MAVIALRKNVDWFAAGWVLRYVAGKLRKRLSVPRLDESLSIAEDGFQFLDLSDLNKEERLKLCKAVSVIVGDLRDSGRDSIADPSFFEGFLLKLEELERLVCSDVAN